MKLASNRPTLVAAGLALAVVGRPSFASTLSDAAAALDPGESIRIATTLPGTMLEQDGANFFQWSSSAAWDPVRREFRFIGKRDSTYPYRFLVYSEGTNSWSVDRALHSSLAASQSGHGYDHNTVDPVTGTHYFRRYGTAEVLAWSGSWSVLTIGANQTEIAAGLTWVNGLARPGVAHSGLVFADNFNLLHFDGNSWRSLGTSPISSYHTISEYSPAGDTLVFGAGNGGNAMWKIDIGASGPVTAIATPPFNMGSAVSQGILVSDPVADQLIGWRKASTEWVQYDVSENRWSSLTRSTGDGSSPQLGTPNLSTSFGSVVAAPVPTYGVVMFVQYLGSGNAGVWLYKHSTSIALPTPNPPTALNVQ